MEIVNRHAVLYGAETELVRCAEKRVLTEGLLVLLIEGLRQVELRALRVGAELGISQEYNTRRGYVGTSLVTFTT